MWVKICANTSLEDTQLAVDLGADAVGFVFAPSARRVTPAQVARITSQLRHGSRTVERIGVFQTTIFEEIRAAVLAADLTGAQLHHEPQASLIARLREHFGPAFTITQTLHWPSDEPPTSIATRLAAQRKQLREAAHIDRILVDARVGSALGGTGTTFAWTEARSLFQEADGIRTIVAGGLNPENVREAMQRLNPWGVDVASGVERVAGSKDPDRLRLFLERARAGTTSL